MLNLVGSKRRKLSVTTLSLRAVVDAFGTGHLFLFECDRACHRRTLTAFGIQLGRTVRYVHVLCWKSVHLHPRRCFPGVDLYSTQGGKITALAGCISRLFSVVPEGDGGSWDGTHGPEFHPGTSLPSSHWLLLLFFFKTFRAFGASIFFSASSKHLIWPVLQGQLLLPSCTTWQAEARQHYTAPHASGCPLDRKPGFTCCVVVAAKIYFPPLHNGSLINLACQFNESGRSLAVDQVPLKQRVSGQIFASREFIARSWPNCLRDRSKPYLSSAESQFCLKCSSFKAKADFTSYIKFPFGCPNLEIQSNIHKWIK